MCNRGVQMQAPRQTVGQHTNMICKIIFFKKWLQMVAKSSKRIITLNHIFYVQECTKYNPEKVSQLRFCRAVYLEH